MYLRRLSSTGEWSPIHHIMHVKYGISDINKSISRPPQFVYVYIPSAIVLCAFIYEPISLNVPPPLLYFFPLKQSRPPICLYLHPALSFCLFPGDFRRRTRGRPFQIFISSVCPARVSLFERESQRRYLPDKLG